MNDVSTHQHWTRPGEHRTASSGWYAKRAAVALAGAAMLTLAWPGAGEAAGSRAAVEAKPGEIVLMRAVPSRPAARSMPPGQALLVDPSPESEIESGLSHLEIASDSYGRVSAGGQGAHRGGIAGNSMSSFMAPLGARSGGDRSPAPKAATGGAMGAATGSIGSHVSGALAGAGLLGQGGSKQ